MSGSSPKTWPLSELQSDLSFLKGYLLLPCKLRRIAADQWAGVFSQSSDDLLRKTALVKLFEEFIASTEDLGMFFFALRDSGPNPGGLVRHCDRFIVNRRESEWMEVLAAIPADGHFLEGHLPPHGVADPPGVDRDAVDRIFRKLTNALRAAAMTRVAGERTLVESRNKITHGMLIRDEGDFVVLDVTRAAESGIPVTQEYVDILRGAVQGMRQATAVIVSALIQKMQCSALLGAYGLSDEENRVLLEAFEDVPPTF